MRRRSTKKEWVELLGLKQESDKSIKAFCEEFGVAVHQFYYWRKRLGDDAKPNDESAGFVRLGLAESSETECRDSGLLLDLRQFHLRLEHDFDDESLRRFLAVAAAMQC